MKLVRELTGESFSSIRLMGTDDIDRLLEFEEFDSAVKQMNAQMRNQNAKP